MNDSARAAPSTAAHRAYGVLPVALRCAEPGAPSGVLVSVADVSGSAPREAGAQMAVTADAVLGTIGGGHLEFEAIAIARAMLVAGEPARMRRFALGAALGQCCGGAVQLLFEAVTPTADWLVELARCVRDGVACVVATSVRGEADDGTVDIGKAVVCASGARGSLGAPEFDLAVLPVARELLDHRGATRLVRLQAGARAWPCLLEPVVPSDWRVVLFGAGHVGRALVRALAELPCAITWVDEREAAFPDELAANVVAVATDSPADEVDAAAPGAHFVVMTHSHALDLALAERILGRDDFASFGLIGSATKRRLFEQRLSMRGVPDERIARMTCPIGVAGIRGKEPAVIALAVAAQLLQSRERSPGAIEAQWQRE